MMNILKNSFLGIKRLIKPPKRRINIKYEQPAYFNRHIGKDFLIIGTGPSLKKYHVEIKKLIKKKSLIVIGVNNTTALISSDYQGFTNRFRFSQSGKVLNPKTRQLLSIYFSDKAIKKNCNTQYELIMWKSENQNPKVCFVDDSGVITHHGTSATLMIMVAYVMGARQIYVAGVDGYGKFLKNGDEENLHFEKNDYKIHIPESELNQKFDHWNIVQKDGLTAIIQWALTNNLLPHKHITPCEYMDLFDGRVLGILDDAAL